MGSVTHRGYFERYRLNGAQYGEILVAQAFGGRKLGDSQPCFDVVTSYANLDAAILWNAGNGLAPVALDDPPHEVRIQVRSKLCVTPSGGKASVVHCKTTDVEGRRSRRECHDLPMTHLAVVFIEPGSRIRGGDPAREGLIHQAWLLTRDKAAELRTKDGKTQYIRVNQLSDDPKGGSVDITRIVKFSAEASLRLLDG